MPDPDPIRMPLGKALLVLGRASNLPTVWSNCFVAYALAGHGPPWSGLVPIMIGATLFYLGGMYLNDAFDVGFDRQYRKERPIPSGVISEKAVWILGCTQLLLGFLSFSVVSRVPYALSLLLAALILIYNALHKRISYSPVLMALCRFVLFLSVASVGNSRITGIALWSAVGLAAYIIGLSYVARRESTGGIIAYWPCLFLIFPAILSYLVNNGPYRTTGVIMIIVYSSWVLHCLRHIYWTQQPKIGKAVSHFLAGIVLLDLMALGLVHTEWTVLMAGLFCAALLFQRFIPAT
ncbi:MAG: 4-hydroxybenzoate octaprenyltransferase [Verrucomicrobia subdivision 3 bacterium]|nr:4-hydroxybenzoate octaprenyltransferase [Limisphaerales bacterium]MCS1414250.1 4-hydroxybenzoate octaprenyltransferase [Limisphaerales bacterium]